MLFVGVQKMNSAVTRCPACATRFNVSESQLEARDGLARCGRCETVFNAREHLLPDEPSPQLSLPIDEGATSGDTDINLAVQPDNNEQGESYIAAEPVEPVEHAMATPSGPVPVVDVSGLEEPPATLAQQVAFHDTEPEGESAVAPGRMRRALAFVFGLMLFLLLLAQASYFFRDELALRLPGLKPLLVQLCEPLACAITLPHDAELLAIISSELEADATHPGVFTLHVILRNNAPHVQALPSLELTLTDVNDQALARRVFAPADYLQEADRHLEALATKRELTLALPLETADLRPTGYRLLLFYPEQP